MTVAGVLVLLVNDHLLKQAWPGLLTGKLSDVAGLVVAPALLALLFWRRADLVATVLTGALYTLVKSTETGAEVASHAWTLVAGPSRVLADPTDLLALPALALAWWVRRRTLRRPASARWRIVVTMPLAVLAVTATGAVHPPPSAHAVEQDGDRIHVHTTLAGTLTSEDGGRTWSPGHRPVIEHAQSAQCVPGQATRCYQVLKDRLGVEQSDDGGDTWRTSWAPSAAELERLTRQYDDPSGLRSRSLAVQAYQGGHVVVVANGLDGIAVRDTSGTWRRVGWPGAEPHELNLDPERNVAIFLAACMLFAGVGAGLRQFALAYTGSALASCLGLLLLVSLDSLPDSYYALGVPIPLLGLLVGLSGAVGCVVLAFAGRARPVPAVLGAMASMLMYGAVHLPFTWWARGVVDTYDGAVRLAVLMGVVVVVVASVTIRIDARRASSDHLTGA
ncbi:hypothetical protein [Nonomuraea gerenzanensis]|uniref:Uncharacterized protein n=1 Tax=Nonomuraea gerenzanensis TaxID=93944 RepID=A0A1M4DXJ1_9ACTN|nr:hypothetical protein [Nonomuraea gerenzanensis]UBU13618.1 hypothetical protein LCN96_00830 [Nonomuraea gerenzanensis]SBO91283.1 hypothetical protein BN4615_P797 [Nonomuraea gerenzanensis]